VIVSFEMSAAIEATIERVDRKTLERFAARRRKS
jgi:hypothetical protein